MFDRDHLDSLLDLQKRSYALLRWIGDKVQSGTLPLSSLHGALEASRAAAEWLSRNMASLPADVRPTEGELERFAHLFASYLVTSFEISSRKKVRAACGCELCAYFVNAANLQVRNPSKLDREISEQLKLDCLEALALEAGVPLLREELSSFLAANADIGRPLVMLAYIRELDRRSTYRGQGRPVLALWRDLAWKGQHLDRKFELTSDKVLRAEESVREKLRNYRV